MISTTGWDVHTKVLARQILQKNTSKEQLKGSAEPAIAFFYNDQQPDKISIKDLHGANLVMKIKLAVASTSLSSMVKSICLIR